jgi:hypothetical protein
MARRGHVLPGLVLFLIGFASSMPGQTLYSYIDQDGVRTFTNIPPTAPVKDMTITGAPPGWQGEPKNSSPAGRTSLDSIIEKYAREYQVDPDLIRSMIRTESGFDPRAVSPKGAQGLMQLMPSTAKRLGVRNPFDPEQNIRGGTQHMRSLLDTFGNDLKLSLAAYNAGENLVQRIGRVPDYRETHNYVRLVTRRYGKSEMAPPQASAPQQTQAYRFVDRDGVVNLTNVPRFRLSETEMLRLLGPQGNQK